MVRERVTGWRERLLYRIWGLSLRFGWSYRLGMWVQRAMLRRAARRAGTLDTSDSLSSRGWLSRARGPLSGWTGQRDFPTPTASSFREWWTMRGGSRP
jgi:hypothetical protein